MQRDYVHLTPIYYQPFSIGGNFTICLARNRNLNYYDMQVAGAGMDFHYGFIKRCVKDWAIYFFSGKGKSLGQRMMFLKL